MMAETVEVVRLGPQTKTRLTTLKRRTHIDNWNVLSRWAFCLSISDPEPVGVHHLDPGTAIEMTWRTFAGEYDSVYEMLLIDRAEIDQTNVGEMHLSDLLRAHISRGVARLTAMKDIDSIAEMTSLSSPERQIL